MDYFLLIYPLLSLAAFFSVFIFPTAALLLFFISPIALLWYLENPGRSRGTDAVSAVIFAASAVFDPVQSLYYLPFILFPVWLLAFARKKGWPSFIPPLAAPLPAALILGGLLLFSSDFRGFINSQMAEFIGDLAAPFENSPERLGDYGAISFILANKERAAHYFAYMIPGITYAVISLFTFVTDRIKPVVKNGEVVLRDYRLPDKLVWGLIAGGFLIIFKDTALKFISYNLLLVFGMLYLYQGVQMISVLFDRFKLSRFFRALVYIFLFTEPPIMILLSVMGLFSIWFRPKWSVRPVETGGKEP